MTAAERLGVARYASLLRVPGARTVVIVGSLARLPIGMTALSLLLLVQQESGSFALGGLASGAFSAALALSAPVRGTGVDRHGARAMLRSYGLAHPAALVCCLVAAVGQLPSAVVLLAALVAGATFPPVGAVIRSLWGELCDVEADRTTAYALDSALIETAFVGGPLLVGVTVAVADPAAAVALSAVFVGAGSLGLASAAVSARLVAQEHGARVPVRAPLGASAVRRLLFALLVLGVGFGATEVAVAAYASDAGTTHLVGPLLALWAGGSAAGGLVYGSRAWPMTASRQYPWLLALLAAGLALPLAALGTWSLGLLLLVGGLAIAPFSACNTTLLAAAAPPGATAATFAWSGSSIVAGIAAGTGSAGWLVDEVGPSAGFAVAAAAGLAAVGTWFAWRLRGGGGWTA